MINYWAVLVAAIVAMVIGGIWWGALFGKMWSRANGFDKLSPEELAKVKKGMPWLYIQQFILSLIQALVLAYVFNKLDGVSLGMGVLVSIILWAGFTLPVQYGDKLWGSKGKTIVLVSLLHSLLTVVVMGLIIACWR